jgi:hypothetical protein
VSLAYNEKQCVLVVGSSHGLLRLFKVNLETNLAAEVNEKRGGEGKRERRERERESVVGHVKEREREKERKKERGRERERVCCVCLRERIDACGRRETSE